MSLLASALYLFVHVHVLYMIAYELVGKEYKYKKEMLVIVSISYVLAKVVPMLLKEFHTSVMNHDPCEKCGTKMAQKRQKNRVDKWVPMLRCPKKGCEMTDKW